MDDSKVGLGLGGGGNISLSITNIKQDILGLSNIITNTLQPAVDKLVRSLNSVKLPQLVDAKGNPISSGGAGNGNVVASNGKSSGSSQTSEGGGEDKNTSGGGIRNQVASINNGFQKYVAASGAVNSGLEASGLMPGVPTAVMQDLLTVRSAFYGQGGFGGSLQTQSANVKALQKSLAHNGLATDSMDSTRSLAVANDTGLSGATNFSQVMQGAADASRFTPGIGIAGATQAIGGTLNAPSTVNMARSIGINLRSPNGSLLPMDQVVDQIWNFLKRQNGGKGMDKKSFQISLMPGNGIYNMLSGLFNGDPTMIQMTANMLLAKAQFGGAELNSIGKQQLVQAGVLSQTAANIGEQTATQTDLTVDQSSQISGGYDASTKFNNAVDKFVSGIDRITGAVGSLNAANQGILGGPVMAIGSSISKILSIFGLASGGPAISSGPMGDGKTPYIVGEEGPELFLPKTDGTIIPNHSSGLNRKTGGPTSAGGASGFTQEDFAKAVITGLGGKATPQAIQDMVYWEGKEGGNWSNTAKYNPLNTSYQSSGSINYNTGKAGSGVQAYSSWQQGVNATIATLTGANAGARGYTDITKALTGGGTSTSNFLKLMQSSSWDANHYQGGTSSSGSTPNSVASTPAAGTTDINSIADAMRTNNSNGAGSVNYGGLTFQFNGITDTASIVKQVKTLINNPTGSIGKS